MDHNWNKKQRKKPSFRSFITLRIANFAGQQQPSTNFMTATLTYTLVLAAIYFGLKAMEVIDQKD